MGNTYCMSDIHNDYERFLKMLRKIKFKDSDKLYILGDYFDRSNKNPKPIQLYLHVVKSTNMIPLLGNHDLWLADDIKAYLEGTLRNRMFPYNTFDIMKGNLEREDLAGVMEWIYSLPRYKILDIGKKTYMLAHALTCEDPEKVDEMEFIMGEVDFKYAKEGIENYVSVIGHMTTDLLRFYIGEERQKKNTIWKNKNRTVFAIDCGCGLETKESQLACLRLDDYAEFYV